MNERYVPDSKERKYFILARLLDDEHLSYKQLSEEYLVSRSSIANDIIFVKQTLKEDGLSLAFDNTGTYICGGGAQRQKAIKRIVTDLLVKLPEKKQVLTVLQLFLDYQVYKQVQAIIWEKLCSWSLEVPEDHLLEIVASTSILISRGKKGFHIEDNNQEQYNQALAQFEKYPLVHKLLETVEQAGLYHFTDCELRYLSLIVIGNGFNYFMENTTIPAAFKKKVKSFIRNVSEETGTDFCNDEKLETALLTHLYQMIFRLQSGTNVINPLLKEIKADYTKIYGVVWYALREFGNETGLKISDDEVAFVTIHFQAAIERHKRERHVLFVCPHGIGTSSLISEQIRQILPARSVLDVISRATVDKQDLTQVDLIVSTVALPSLPVPVVQVSPRFTAADMKKVAQKLIDVTLIQSLSTGNQALDWSKICTILKNKIFFGSAANQEEVIAFLTKQNKWSSHEKEQNYEKSVLKREQFQTTYLENGFAIPHGDPQKVDVSCIAIYVSDKPIAWDGHQVDVVSLLMIRNEDKAAVEPFMNLVMRGINDKEWFISIVKEIKQK
ncbi:PRD domain-containing protein [Lactobacillus sp. ESL0791]|uniref:BglG family transcription antiterminator n=1 Tax=Lactobacillus sp. ESL0791 TaxID=2983234 RepID=UPI0023F68276|nr:PRD domain-containing protein [Lactobacillus sp. ESL0791]MDF7639250.1 PRD domain-containing protein [Lactobacillus sp. ESL0791]